MASCFSPFECDLPGADLLNLVLVAKPEVAGRRRIPAPAIALPCEDQGAMADTPETVAAAGGPRRGPRRLPRRPYRECGRRPPVARPPEAAPGRPRDCRARSTSERMLEWPSCSPARQTTRGLPTEYGGCGDVGGSVAAFETLALGDLSVLVKVGVQVGAVRWRDPPARDQGAPRRLPGRRRRRLNLGCFAMTESGHGSDVRSGPRPRTTSRRRSS